MSSLRNRSMKALLGAVFAGVFVGCQSTPTSKSEQYVTDPVTKRTLRVEPEQQNVRVGASTYFAYGHLLERQGQFAQAAEQYEKALAAQPRFPSANNRLGITYNKLGRHDEASVQFQLALSSSPNDVQMLNNLGYSQFLEGKYAEAERTLRGAIQVRPDFTRAQMNLGLVLAKQQRWADAYQAFSSATNSADAHYNLAVVQAECGLYANAARSLEAALSADPGHPYARAQLREISHLASQGDNPPATPQANQFATNTPDGSTSGSSTMDNAPMNEAAPNGGGSSNFANAAPNKMNDGSTDSTTDWTRSDSDTSSSADGSTPIAGGAPTGGTSTNAPGTWNNTSPATGTMTPMTPAPSRPMAANPGGRPSNNAGMTSPSNTVASTPGGWTQPSTATTASPRPSTAPMGQMTMMPLRGPTGSTQNTLTPSGTSTASTTTTPQPVAASPNAMPNHNAPQGTVSAASLPPGNQPDFSPKSDPSDGDMSMPTNPMPAHSMPSNSMPADSMPANSSGGSMDPNSTLPHNAMPGDEDCDESTETAQPSMNGSHAQPESPSMSSRTQSTTSTMAPMSPTGTSGTIAPTTIKLAGDAATTTSRPPTSATPMQSMTPVKR
ncbi:MAG: tetratricopeptide repeat protein [Phycisphaerae bacterium]|nr:tetratricopeptide repeat protein [Phycisphaerae bacterium]